MKAYWTDRVWLAIGWLVMDKAERTGQMSRFDEMHEAEFTPRQSFAHHAAHHAITAFLGTIALLGAAYGTLVFAYNGSAAGAGLGYTVAVLFGIFAWGARSS